MVSHVAICVACLVAGCLFVCLAVFVWLPACMYVFSIVSARQQLVHLLALFLSLTPFRVPLPRFRLSSHFVPANERTKAVRARASSVVGGYNCSDRDPDRHRSHPHGSGGAGSSGDESGEFSEDEEDEEQEEGEEGEEEVRGAAGAGGAGGSSSGAGASAASRVTPSTLFAAAGDTTPASSPRVDL